MPREMPFPRRSWTSAVTKRVTKRQHDVFEQKLNAMSGREEGKGSMKMKLTQSW
jgi:hypothetical protein